MANVVETHKFVLTCSDQNNNKFWRVTLYDNDDVEIHYGRVGAEGSKKLYPRAGRSRMEKDIRKKTTPDAAHYGDGICYTEVKTLDAPASAPVGGGRVVQNVQSSNLKSIATQQIQFSSAETRKLIEWLADVNRHNIAEATKGAITYNVDSGLFQTPLGIVMPDSIVSARDLLDKISDAIQARKDAERKRLLDQYMRIIPTNVGHKRGWEENFCVSDSQVQAQNAILDALDASYRSVVDGSAKKDTTKKDEPAAPKVFDVKLEDCSDTNTLSNLERMFSGTRSRMHSAVYGCHIHKVWRVSIAEETKRFPVAETKYGNVRDDLWHGTNASNLLSILKGGLIIPPSGSPHVTGRLYGDGVYASDMSTKALNYATGFWGQRDTGRYFMFHVKFAMGNIYYPNGGFRRLPSGYHSTFAKAGVSGVINNEMIVYTTNQVQICELVEFRK